MDRGSQLDEDDEDDKDDEEDEEDEEERRRRRRRRTRQEATYIKSNNPHLAGGEKTWPLLGNPGILMEKNTQFMEKKHGHYFEIPAF